MAIFGNTPADEMTLIERDAANRAAAYENLKRQGDLPALGLIFGLNLMKNSQTQGLGSAVGNAGMDALKTHQAVMNARRATAQDEIANSLGMAKYNLEVAKLMDERAKAKREADAEERASAMLGNVFGVPSPVATNAPVVSNAPVGKEYPGGFTVTPLPEDTAIPAGYNPRQWAKGAVEGIDDLIQTSAAKHGVDPNMIADIVEHESRGLNIPTSAGPGTAYGPMQTIAAHYANPEDRKDPVKNIDTGTRLFADMMKRYNGNVSDAARAYAVGAGNVDKWIANGRKLDGLGDDVKKYWGVGEEMANYMASRAANRGTQPQASRSESGMGSGAAINLTPDQITNLVQVAATNTDAGKTARSVLDLYYKEQGTLNGQWELRDGRLINTRDGTVKRLKNEDGTFYETPQEIKAKTEAEEKAKADRAKQENAIQDAMIQLHNIDEAIKLANDPGLLFGNTGWFGDRLKDVAGTDAYALNKHLDTIKSGVFINSIMNMKNASTTGATGMGALSETEGKKMEGARGSLEIGQDRKALVNNLNIIKTIYEDTIRKYMEDYGYTPEQINNRFGVSVNIPSGNSGNGDLSGMSDEDLLKALGN